MKKYLISILFLWITMIVTQAQNLNKMQKSLVKTNLGDIAVYQNTVENENTPIIFLHGVYFDHHMWDEQVGSITDRKIMTIDMPWHGESKENVPSKWNLDNCGVMLLEILDSLKIDKVIAIGQSWGSMTILRAINKKKEKFASIGFCNMPFKETSSGTKLAFRFQHTMLGFRKFYYKAVSKALFGKKSVKENPKLIQVLSRPMAKLSNKEIKQIDRFVILQATDVTSILEKLNVPVLALKGKEDYVPTPPTNIPTKIVEGGHVSPLQVPQEVLSFVKEVIDLETNYPQSKP